MGKYVHLEEAVVSESDGKIKISKKKQKKAEKAAKKREEKIEKAAVAAADPSPIQEPEKKPVKISEHMSTKIKRHFVGNELLRNSDIRDMLELGKDHGEAGRILRECEARGLLTRAKETKQAVFYKPGPKL